MTKTGEKRMFEQAEEEKGQIAHLQVRQPVSTLCCCGFPLDANDTGDEIFMFCAGSPIPRHKVTFRKGPSRAVLRFLKFILREIRSVKG